MGMFTKSFSLLSLIGAEKTRFSQNVSCRHPYNKVTRTLSVCLYRRFSLTTEPIWFSFTDKLLLGPGKVYDYFRGGYIHYPKFVWKLKIGGLNFPLPSTPRIIKYEAICTKCIFAMNHFILLTLLKEHPMFNCHGYKSKLEEKIAFWERLYN